mgnify:CR=1 FL=1
MTTQKFPTNIAEFLAVFASEEECRAYWFTMRWPNGFLCPHCDHGSSPVETCLHALRVATRHRSLLVLHLKEHASRYVSGSGQCFS